tara:strand:- start:34 stop:228 length:195 start_codon:yes stop_codon:yes gene_type:complete
MPLALNSEMRSALLDDDRRDTEAQRRGLDDFIRDGNTHTVAHVAKAICSMVAVRAMRPGFGVGA